jgi:uncharacterized protein DUF6457
MTSGDETVPETYTDEWVDRLAGDLGEPPMTSQEIGRVLKLAREVAHGAERKLAPLAAFIAGTHVGRRAAEGASRDAALSEAVRAAAALLPDQQAADTEDPASRGGD